MARLARGAPRRSAGDGTHLASARRSLVLDIKESTSHGAAGRANRCPRIDSRDVPSKSTLGHTSDSRRAPQVGDLRKSVDGRDVHAAASAAAVPNVADLPHQSCEPDHGCRPVRRAHRDVPAAFCPYDPCARPSSDRPRGDHGSSTAAWTAQQLRNAFPKTTHLGIYCTIAIRSLPTWRPPSRA